MPQLWKTSRPNIETVRLAAAASPPSPLTFETVAKSRRPTAAALSPLIVNRQPPPPLYAGDRSPSLEASPSSPRYDQLLIELRLAQVPHTRSQSDDMFDSTGARNMNNQKPTALFLHVRVRVSMISIWLRVFMERGRCRLQGDRDGWKTRSRNLTTVYVVSGTVTSSQVPLLPPSSQYTSRSKVFGGCTRELVAGVFSCVAQWHSSPLRVPPPARYSITHLFFFSARPVDGCTLLTRPRAVAAVKRSASGGVSHRPKEPNGAETRRENDGWLPCMVARPFSAFWQTWHGARAAQKNIKEAPPSLPPPPLLLLPSRTFSLLGGWWFIIGGVIYVFPWLPADTTRDCGRFDLGHAVLERASNDIWISDWWDRFWMCVCVSVCVCVCMKLHCFFFIKGSRRTRSAGQRERERERWIWVHYDFDWNTIGVHRNAAVASKMRRRPPPKTQRRSLSPTRRLPTATDVTALLAPSVRTPKAKTPRSMAASTAQRPRRFRRIRHRRLVAVRNPCS